MIALILFACFEKNDYVNPLAVDNDGDGYTEFGGDQNDANPEYVNDLACPDVHLTCPEPVINLTCPMPDTNLICPEPIINLSCPEPVVQVEVAAPDVQVAVAAPEVNVNVAGPDMTGIEAAIDDMTIAIEDAISNQQNSSNRTYHAQSGTLNGASIIMTNNDSRSFIITSILPGYSGGIDCQTYDVNGGLLIDVCDSNNCIRRTPHSSAGFSEGLSNHNNLTIPVHPGEYIQCSPTHPATSYIMQGYYQ